MNKKIFTVIISVLFIASVFSGCGSSAAEKAKKTRILYSNVKLSDYVDLGEYKGLSVDTASDEYKEEYNACISEDIALNDFYFEKKDAIADGDIANIDYIGKKDGVAFDGGTAEGYDLEIGSNSFINGFEDGLIGAVAGETLDLNLKFPDDYGNEELNGKEVVFTVTVNSVRTPDTPENYFNKLDFKTVDDYYADISRRTAKVLLLNQLCENAEIGEYPKEDYDMLLEIVEEQFDSRIQTQYGINLETYLQYTNSTIETFRSQLAANVLKPMMDEQLAAYALIDGENIPLTAEDTKVQLEKLCRQYGDDVSEDEIKEYFGNYYFEALAANDKAADYLYENAKIK